MRERVSWAWGLETAEDSRPTPRHLPARRALELLHDVTSQRFTAIQESAVEQAEAVGEADLRRLKRQFSSLKNTFLHYEVKNEFLAGVWSVGNAACPPAASCRRRHPTVGAAARPPTRLPARPAELLDGRPHGDEGDLLQHFEAEVEQSVQHLRQLKAGNERAAGAIAELVSQIAAAHDAFERRRVALGGELARLQQDVAQHEQDVAQPLPELAEGGCGAEGCSGGPGHCGACKLLDAPVVMPHSSPPHTPRRTALLPQARARRSARWRWRR